MPHLVGALNQEPQREAVDPFVPHRGISQFDQLFGLSRRKVFVSPPQSHVLQEGDLPISPFDILESKQKLRQAAGSFGVALQRIDPKHLLEAAADSAVRRTLYPLIAEQKWETIGGPEVNIKKMARGSDFEYEAIFPLIPEIKLGDWKDLKVSKKPVEAKDDETEKVIQDLREQRADFIPIDRGIAKGDQVEMEYEMYMDNLRTEEGKQKTDKMIIGRGLFFFQVVAYHCRQYPNQVDGGPGVQYNQYQQYDQAGAAGESGRVVVDYDKSDGDGQDGEVDHVPPEIRTALAGSG